MLDDSLLEGKMNKPHKFKYCYRCKQTLPIESFSKERSNKTGLQVYCKNCRKKIRNVYDKTNRGKQVNSKSCKKHSDKIKREVFDYYSNGEMKCELCSKDDFRILTIDHINGNGLKHRELIGFGSRLYRWLKRNNFPDGYRILCFNCNWLEKKRVDDEKRKSLENSKDTFYIKYGKKYVDGRRLEVIRYYSNGTFKCDLCGINEFNTLIIDHIDGGGKEHRKMVANEIGSGGDAFFRWLIKNNYPKGFRVLCRNCNWLEHLKRNCPRSFDKL